MADALVFFLGVLVGGLLVLVGDTQRSLWRRPRSAPEARPARGHVGGPIPESPHTPPRTAGPISAVPPSPPTSSTVRVTLHEGSPPPSQPRR